MGQDLDPCIAHGPDAWCPQCSDDLRESLKRLKADPMPVRALLATDVHIVILADAKLAKDGPVVGALDTVLCSFLPPGCQIVQYSDGSLKVRTKNGKTFDIPAPTKTLRKFGQFPMRNL